MTIEELNKQFHTDYKTFDDIDWKYISEYQNLTEDFIREFQNKVDWFSVSSCQKLSEDFIREFKDQVDWRRVSVCQCLSEDFIREFKDQVDWGRVSNWQKLSEDFIREFKDRVDWVHISVYQNLSEDFIRKFQDRVNWMYVSKFQKLSEDFIREFKDKVNWGCISKYQKLSEDFANEFENRVNTDLVKDNWIYKDAAFKKQQVERTGLYECHDDYFIAYKGIRSDRYSEFNFQYKYEKSGKCESWCDCSSNENSFGLSVWTEKKAREYCDELVIKVKVRYEDVGRVVHDGGKVRCFRIEVLD